MCVETFRVGDIAVRRHGFACEEDTKLDSRYHGYQIGLASWKQHVPPEGLDPTGGVNSGFIELSGSLVTTTLDTVKATRFAEVEVMCHSAQSNSFEFEWQPDTKEDAGVAILPLFAHNKKAQMERWAATQVHLPLKQNTESEDTYQRIGFQLGLRG